MKFNLLSGSIFSLTMRHVVLRLRSVNFKRIGDFLRGLRFCPLFSFNALIIRFFFLISDYFSPISSSNFALLRRDKVSCSPVFKITQ